MPRPQTLSAARLSLLLVFLSGCAGGPRGAVDEVHWLADHGEFEAAVRVAAEHAQENPGDARAQSLHREASVAYLLDQGRRKTLDSLSAEEDVQALAIFEEARLLAPESQIVRDWIEKTNHKLAAYWRDVAFELHASDEIEPALEAYEKALAYEPGDKSAIEGRTLAQLIIAHRKMLGTTYFNEGLHALSDYWLEVARSRFGYSEKYAPDDQRPTERRRGVDKLLASQRLELARKFEGERRFGAARNEYRIAKALEPENAEALAGVDRCGLEQQVAEKLKLVDMELVRGRFAAAVKLVEAASKLTVAQKDLVEGKHAAIREARLEKAYQDALALERDDRFAEAVVAYSDLLKQVDYFKDVLARRDTLNEYIRLAGDLYAKYESAATDEERLDSLLRIQVFWPEYKDVNARVEALRAAIPPPPAPPSGS